MERIMSQAEWLFKKKYNFFIIQGSFNKRTMIKFIMTRKLRQPLPDS